MIKRAMRNKSFTEDSFSNFMANLGLGTDNQMSASTYSLNNLISRNRTLLEASYRSSWLIGQCVDAIAEDMTKMGITMLSKMKPDNINKLNVALDDFYVWKSLCETIKWARLYGGCIAVILIDGQKYENPLDLDRIGNNTFKGLLVLDRWMCEPSLTELVDDMNKDWGKPKFYRMHTSIGKIRLPQLKIHYSRVLRFDGITLPFYQKVYENYWGLSVIERMYDRLIAYDSSTLGAAQLVYKSFLRTIKVKGLREKLAMGGREEKAILKMFQYIKMMQTNEGITLLDAADEFDIKTNSFGGLADLLNQFGEQISGATGIPLVRLFGQSPAGFSTGETDLRNYYDGINREQENTLRPNLSKLLEIMGVSLFGERLPTDFEYDFNSLWKMSDKEKAEINTSVTTSISEAITGDIITKSTGLKELQQSSRVTGIFTNITDEEVEAAKIEQQNAPPPGLGGEEGSESEFESGEEHREQNEESIEEDPKTIIPEVEEQAGADKKKRIDSESKLPLSKGKDKKVINLKEARILFGKAINEAKKFVHDSSPNKEWIGVDFDATLAEYYGWNDGKLGEPIPKMIDYVKELLDDGETVKIFTARVDNNPEAEHQIKLWCAENGLPELEVTNKKDMWMKMLLDDRAKQVKANTGKIIDIDTEKLDISGSLIKDFEEQKHPRAKGGKHAGEFTAKGSGSSSSSNSEKTKVKRAERGKYEKHKAGKDAEFSAVKRDKDGSMKLSDGKPLPKHLSSLKMPPAYKDVKVNPDPKGSLLATAIAENGKKQWFYSKKHDEQTTKQKDGMIKDLSKNYAKIDKQVEKDLSKGNENALITKLVSHTGIRIGSTEKQLGEKKAFGATLLESQHLIPQKDGSLNLEFTGKKGVDNVFKVSDPALVKQLLKLKKEHKQGEKIFATNYNECLKYIKSLDGGSFTPKNFRTKVATDLAVKAVSETEPPTSEKEYKKAVKAVAKQVAERLNNTAGVTLRKYIVPSVWSDWRKKAGIK